MEKLSQNRAQLFLRNKYTVFTMGGPVALRSVINFFSGELQFCSNPGLMMLYIKRPRLDEERMGRAMPSEAAPRKHVTTTP